MEWDLSRVYTAVNADEVKVGSKVICADTMKDLKRKVENEKYEITEIESIKDESHEYRFTICFANYLLCYLVEEPSEPKLKWTDLKIGDVIRNKEANTITRMVTGIDTAENHEHIEIGGYWLRDNDIEQWEKVE